MKLIASLLLSLTLVASVACHKGPIAVHPGAKTNLDSYAYDILLVEQEALNRAKDAFAQGRLPAAAKDSLNSAVDQYNTALGAWQSYHSGVERDDNALQSAIDALVGAAGALQKQMGTTLPEAPAAPKTPTAAPQAGILQLAPMAGV